MKASSFLFVRAATSTAVRRRIAPSVVGGFARANTAAVSAVAVHRHRGAASAAASLQAELLVKRWWQRVGDIDSLSLALMLLSVANVAATYMIIFDWLYQGHCSLWDGTYGVEDDEDEDDNDDA
jgi:hypothetical protein